jgi:hypothetical protein
MIKTKKDLLKWYQDQGNASFKNDEDDLIVRLDTSIKYTRTVTDSNHFYLTMQTKRSKWPVYLYFYVRNDDENIIECFRIVGF